jgi:hypothetical protein
VPRDLTLLVPYAPHVESRASHPSIPPASARGPYRGPEPGDLGAPLATFGPLPLGARIERELYDLGLVLVLGGGVLGYAFFTSYTLREAVKGPVLRAFVVVLGASVASMALVLAAGWLRRGFTSVVVCQRGLRVEGDRSFAASFSELAQVSPRYDSPEAPRVERLTLTRADGVSVTLSGVTGLDELTTRLFEASAEPIAKRCHEELAREGSATLGEATLSEQGVDLPSLHLDWAELVHMRWAGSTVVVGAQGAERHVSCTLLPHPQALRAVAASRAT